MLRFRNGPPNAHDSDWETVTSDHLFSRQKMSQFQSHVETGSSVADVSDTISYGYCGTSLRPPVSYTTGPGFGSTRKPSTHMSTRTRLQAAVRRVSSSLDGITAPRERGAQAFEMKQFNGSFDSLNSTASSEYFGSGNHWQGFESSRDPQRALFSEVPPVDGANGIVGIPRLPFPLISLPEAAKLQKGRIERGEEDHTDPGGSFVTRAHSETRSTISSTNSPRTPRSVLFSHSHIGSSRDHVDKSSPAYSRWDSPRSHGMHSFITWTIEKANFSYQVCRMNQTSAFLRCCSSVVNGGLRFSRPPTRVHRIGCRPMKSSGRLPPDFSDSVASLHPPESAEREMILRSSSNLSLPHPSRTLWRLHGPIFCIEDATFKIVRNVWHRSLCLSFC